MGSGSAGQERIKASGRNSHPAVVLNRMLVIMTINMSSTCVFLSLNTKGADGKTRHRIEDRHPFI